MLGDIRAFVPSCSRYNLKKLIVCFAAASNRSIKRLFWAPIARFVNDFVGAFSVASALTARACAVSRALYGLFGAVGQMLIVSKI